MNAQELTGVYLQLNESISTIRREIDRDHAVTFESKEKIQALQMQLSGVLEREAKLQSEVDDLHERLRITEKEVAVLQNRLDEATKRIETWSTRAWSLVPIFIGAILSLSAGLIVALVKR